MQVNWRRGFFRAWVVVALAWVGVMGWREYTNKPWNLEWGVGFRTEGECWDRLAKWPDGQPFDLWDVFDDVDVPSNVELNQKKHTWAADAIPERNRWVAATRQKLRDCEAAAPIMQRLSLKMTNIWSSLVDSLPILLLPPLVLLLVGWTVNWILRGFGAGAA
jgi:hypothetical protein